MMFSDNYCPGGLARTFLGYGESVFLPIVIMDHLITSAMPVSFLLFKHFFLLIPNNL